MVLYGTIVFNGCTLFRQSKEYDAYRQLAGSRDYHRRNLTHGTLALILSSNPLFHQLRSSAVPLDELLLRLMAQTRFGLQGNLPTSKPDAFIAKLSVYHRGNMWWGFRLQLLRAYQVRAAQPLNNESVREYVAAMEHYGRVTLQLGDTDLRYGLTVTDILRTLDPPWDECVAAFWRIVRSLESSRQFGMIAEHGVQGLKLLPQSVEQAFMSGYHE